MASPRTPLTVALADSRWYGHHPTYFIEFANSFLRLGHRIICLSGEPEKLEEGVRREWETAEWRFDERVFVSGLTEPMTGIVLRGRANDPVSAVVRWRCLSRALGRAEIETGWQADLVFLNYLDGYLRFQLSTRLPNLLRRPWAGLYFRNHHFGEKGGMMHTLAKGNRTLRNENCAAVGVLDERFDDGIMQISGREPIHFPDITDETNPSRPSAHSLELTKLAAGRKIIGMVGLEKRKGVLTLLRIAEAAGGNEDWFFVAAGVYSHSTFDGDDKAYIKGVQRKVESGELDNLYLCLPGARINDGEDFNSLVKTFDVLFVAYEDFHGSSNALTKAAVFEKPVLATRGQCIGNRVESHGIGVTIGQGQVDEGISAIRSILAGRDSDGNALKLDFKGYYAKHNRERLDKALGEIVERIEQ